MENAIYPVLVSMDITQAQLAKKVGVKREYINRIINGKIVPKIPLGLKIANALNMQVEELFFFTDIR